MTEISRLKKNILFLSLIQAANYFFPLILIPYLVRALGAEKFGLMSFSQAFVQYFIMVTDYGFNLSATKEISICRDDKLKVSKIFTSVIFVKFLLFLLCLFLMLLIVFLIPFFRKDMPLYLISFSAVFGHVVFPQWIFQGLEEMKYVTVSNLIGRTLAILSIVLIVKGPEDCYLAVGLQSGGVILTAIIGLLIVRSKMMAKIILPNFDDLKDAFGKGFHLFISTSAISLYTCTNTFILGLVGGYEAAGYFSAAEKIIKSAQGFLSPVFQALYPHVSLAFSKSKSEAIAFVKKTSLIVGLGSLAVSVFIAVSSEWLVDFFLGHEFFESVSILQILAFLPFIVSMSNLLGIQMMLPLGMERLFSRIIVMSGLINICFIVPLAWFFQGIGAAMSVVITETLVFISMAIVVFRKVNSLTTDIALLSDNNI